MNYHVTRLCVLLLIIVMLAGCSAYEVRKIQLNHRFKCADMVEAKADLENGTVKYWHGGSGTPVLMIHGFGADAQYLWYDQVGAFTDDYQVITPDLVYFGGSTSDKNDFSIDFQVETVVQLMDHLKIDKLHCMGVSYGGLVAFKLANDYPDRVMKLVIVDSP